MKKVTALVGSSHKGGATYTAARRFLEDLESFGDVQVEIIVLSDYDIGLCRGCKVCFVRGEEYCPLKDDRDVLIEKNIASDALGLMSFRMSRTRINLMLGEANRDYVYYRDQDWFESDYYYPTHLGPFKKAAGAVFDWIGARGQAEGPSPK